MKLSIHLTYSTGQKNVRFLMVQIYNVNISLEEAH